MALTKIRRLLIAFVGFLLVINLVLLGVARYGQSQAASRITYNIVAWIDEADQASSLKSAVEAPGRTVSLTEAPREVKTPAGFRLVMSGKPALLGPVAESLKVKKRPVKLVADGTEIQWGGPFPDRGMAAAMLAGVPLWMSPAEMEARFPREPPPRVLPAVPGSVASFHWTTPMLPGAVFPNRKNQTSSHPTGRSRPAICSHCTANAWKRASGSPPN